MQVLYDAFETFFVTRSLRNINEDDLNERGDYGVPFSEQQYTHGSCYIYISLCLNANSLISLIPRMAFNFRHLLSCGTIRAVKFH